MIISVVGLGYVGLPLAIRLAEHFKVIGFDINTKRIEQLRNGVDKNSETAKDEILKVSKNLELTSESARIKDADFVIISVPTPIFQDKRPDLGPLEGASAVVGKNLKKGSIVVYESTTYPGCTEEFCLPILEKNSGMNLGEFFIGYSPERINPGDKEHSIDKVFKIVSGCDAKTLGKVDEVYGKVTKTYRASSIRIAEAAKVIENIQRDINIALFNELSMLFETMNLDSKEIFDAAATKWNFLRFKPGLVGGHCIPVDPYYLSNKAQELDFFTDVILAGRRVNEHLPAFLAEKSSKLLATTNHNFKDSRILILGASYKENVRDLRSSKVGMVIQELVKHGISDISIYDPIIQEEQIFEITNKLDGKYDLIMLAVCHKEFENFDFQKHLKPSGIVVDVPRKVDKASIVKNGFTYWGL